MSARVAGDGRAPVTVDEAAATARHWDDRYLGTAVTDVSWFEERPSTSIELIEVVTPSPARSVVDVGGGASRLVDHLVSRGDDVTVLDISPIALDRARARVSGIGTAEWIATDVRDWAPSRQWDVWHDRALLHFLLDTDDVSIYVEVLRRAVGPGGAFVLGVFAEDGPTHCSALPVRRYTRRELRDLVAGAEIVDERRTLHTTPSGSAQSFRWLTGRVARD